MKLLAVDAPAKVNLYLRILRRRPDGYHELETLLHALDLCDTLEARPGAGDFALELASRQRQGLEVVQGEDNLVLRAVRAWRAAGGEVQPLDFRLHKRIPAGGGLGGGSADAAAALRLCEHLATQGLGAARLHEVAATLGADVPFFIRAGSQWGTGRGDHLQMVEGVPHYHFLLLFPPLGTSTPAVYQNLAAHLTVEKSPASIPGDRAYHFEELSMPSGFPNDLEAAALDLHPELAEWSRRIAAAGYPSVRMSGSGSTFFLAFADAGARDAAHAALAPLRDEGLGLCRCASLAGGAPQIRSVEGAP